MITGYTDDDREATKIAMDELRMVAIRLPEDFEFEVEDKGHAFNFYSEWSRFDPWMGLVYALENEYIFNRYEAIGLAEAWRTGKPITELSFEISQDGHTSTYRHNRIPFSASRYGGDSPRCADCGMRDFYTDGFKIWPETSCPYPNGIPVQVEIEIPSGRLMVGNDFRQEFSIENDDFSVNDSRGIRDCIEAYAEVGMLHFFVGNSCPSAFRNWHDPDHLIVANPVFDEDGDKALPIPGYDPESVASVCTDLWWVSIVDADEAEAHGLTCEGAPGWTENYIVDVTPGTYVLDYHGLMRDFDRDSSWDEDNPTPTIYGDIYRKASAASSRGHRSVDTGREIAYSCS